MTGSSARDLPWVRIIVEGVVIVGSILLAFAIEAAWDGRQDRAREESYLQLLATDLRETLRNNDRFSARAEPIDLATASLARAYYEPELPPGDSLLRWFGRVGGVWVVQARLGTAESLVATGDVSLIRDDSVRAAIASYLTTMVAFEGFEEDGRDDWRAARRELTHHVSLELLELQLLAAAERDSLASANPLYPFPAGRLRALHAVDVEALVRDDEVHRILVRMNADKTSMSGYRRLMRTRSEELLAQIEAELGGREF